MRFLVEGSGTGNRPFVRGWLPGLAALACAVGLLVLGSCYGPTPSTPPRPTTTIPTTTTTSTTTTTTTVGPTTSSTSTTTTGGQVNYANQVHPIWSSQGCTASGCHAGGPPPNLAGSATDSCTSISNRDASNNNLVITGGGAGNSQLITKPQPSGIGHAGGSFSCFNPGSSCYNTVLTWLQQGANGPGPGGTCGG